jgi:hypothetical protein
MIAIPIALLISATVGLGLYLGYRYLKRIRNTPGLIGTHFLLGAASFEPMVLVLRGGVAGHAKLSLIAMLMVGGVGLALFSGVTAVMIGRKSRQTANIALATHAGFGLSVFLLMVAWALTL